MKCLITGAGGFLGSHLAKYLAVEGHTVYAAHHRPLKESFPENLIAEKLSVAEPEAFSRLMSRVKPDYVFHLAAQSLVIPSWEDPIGTFETNINGTIRLFDAVVKAGISPRILVASSSTVYKAQNSSNPVREEDALEPSSPYAVSKLAQDHLARLYGIQHHLAVMRMRPFLVIGPRKKQDVCTHFAKGIVAIEREQKSELNVGNLDAVRDFVDIQDAVRAIWIMAEKGEPGGVYNLCSGKGTAIREILEMMIQMSSIQIKTVRDPARFRPLDEAIRIGNNDRLRALGWKMKRPIQDTLQDILNYYRQA